jgi:hypothetical protein
MCAYAESPRPGWLGSLIIAMAMVENGDIRGLKESHIVLFVDNFLRHTLSIAMQ